MSLAGFWGRWGGRLGQCRARLRHPPPPLIKIQRPPSHFSESVNTHKSKLACQRDVTLQTPKCRRRGLGETHVAKPSTSCLSSHSDRPGFTAPSREQTAPPRPHVALLLLGRKRHFLGFYFIYNLWKEVEHSCVSLYRILTVKPPGPHPNPLGEH